MPTRDDYERLVSHILKEGDVVRVPCRDDAEYHAERMKLFRLLKTMKAQGLDVGNIVFRKHTKDKSVFLEIEHLKEGPKVIFVTEDGEEEQTIDRKLPTREDQEFEKWMASVHELRRQENESG